MEGSRSFVLPWRVTTRLGRGWSVGHVGRGFVSVSGGHAQDPAEGQSSQSTSPHYGHPEPSWPNSINYFSPPRSPFTPPARCRVEGGRAMKNTALPTLAVYIS